MAASVKPNWEETRRAMRRELNVSADGRTNWLGQSATHPSMWVIVTGPGPTHGELLFVAPAQGIVIGVMVVLAIA